MKKQFLYLSLLAGIFFTACNDEPAKTEPETEVKPAEVKIKEDNVTYKLDTLNMSGYIAYDENSDKKRPAVLVIHEWWGLNDYTKRRAKQLAELGYIAMAIDLYGNGKQADNPGDAGKLAGAFYGSPQTAKARFDAALAKLKEYSQVDTSNIAVIGYCFGGSMALNIAKLGENLKGVVSFHGNLAGVPANRDLLKASVLVCHGEADSFVKPEEVAQFKKQMDSIKADFTFKSYPGATHAFTNPEATEKGKKFNIPIAYNAAADSASWNDMKEFFGKVLR
jgi:dienelactone hydrolase